MPEYNGALTIYKHTNQTMNRVPISIEETVLGARRGTQHAKRAVVPINAEWCDVQDQSSRTAEDGVFVLYDVTANDTDHNVEPGDVLFTPEFDNAARGIHVRPSLNGLGVRTDQVKRWISQHYNKDLAIVDGEMRNDDVTRRRYCEQYFLSQIIPMGLAYQGQPYAGKNAHRGERLLVQAGGSSSTFNRGPYEIRQGQRVYVGLPHWENGRVNQHTRTIERDVSKQKLALTVIPEEEWTKEFHQMLVDTNMVNAAGGCDNVKLILTLHSIMGCLGSRYLGKAAENASPGEEFKIIVGF